MLCRRWLSTLTLPTRPSDNCTTLPKKEAELPGALSAEVGRLLARPFPSLAMASCTGPLVSWKKVGEVKFRLKLELLCVLNS